MKRDGAKAVDATGTYLGDVFVRGDLDATAGWSSSMFEIATTGGTVRAAKMSSKVDINPHVTGEMPNINKGPEGAPVKNSAAPDGCPCCFAGGTPVLTKDGLKPIEQLKEGELVASRNDKTGEIEWKPVTARFVNDDDRLTYALVLVDDKGQEEKYEVTDNHPFNVEGLGWVDSNKLKVGMKVPSYKGGYLTVVSFTALNRSPKTYNVEVQDFHTYFVGDQGAWVHNQCKCGLSTFIPKEESASGRPIFQVDAQKYPNHTSLLDEALASGHSLENLTKVSTRQADKNRYLSQKAVRKEKGAPDEGFNYDEFPYASTKQGGEGATIKQLTAEENQTVGRDLGAFYKKAKVKDGDDFDIEIINR